MRMTTTTNVPKVGLSCFLGCSFTHTRPRCIFSTLPGTADIKPQSSLLSAIIKYGQDRGGARSKSMDQEELAYARDHLDAKLMNLLQYTHPASASR
jgi:hypothetical protein